MKTKSTPVAEYDKPIMKACQGIVATDLKAWLLLLT